jgi:hypothetical protein
MYCKRFFDIRFEQVYIKQLSRFYDFTVVWDDVGRWRWCIQKNVWNISNMDFG